MVKWFLESNVLWALIHRFGGGYITIIGPKGRTGLRPNLTLSYDGPFEHAWWYKERGWSNYCTYEDAIDMIKQFIRREGIRRIVFY